MDDAAPSALLTLLDLEEIGPDIFRGHSPPSSGRQVYGGQAVAQALVAATRTAPADRPIHSLHGYFVLAGDPATPIDFSVERVRDGKSFTTRRCNATQRGHTIFSMEASFQRREQGLTHAAAMPDAPDPESLDDMHVLVERFRAFLPDQVESWLKRRNALDMRVVAPGDVFVPERRAAGQMIWFRVRGALPDDPALHTALLAYLSDMTLLNTALLVHGLTIFDPKFQVASLDHALWIHEAPRVDQWLLYFQQSPWAGGARALTRGQIFAREGRLVATVSQEGLVRPRGAPGS